ncbi:family 20 glycosylhydrolase [Hoylesella enoeca]|uniref:family 20 glycosylhydrolase n=1 Tax=Hoylesella enoeca TaxID=76123 RepID=UPI00131F0598|nr:family 20 glycosylhydrolase [Hoylesella enoeca]
MMLCLVEPTHARSIHLLPIPQRIELKGAGEYFVLGRSVSVVDPTNCALLQDFLNENKCVQVRKAKQRIVIQLVDSIPEAFDEPLAGYENESYALSVTPNEIRIHAISATGVIRAVQTLQQLAEGYVATTAVECGEIRDWPAFKLRGFMHDAGRSFIPVKELKRQIRLLSRFKVNTFHWHLTDNQAWRFEVKAFPELTSARSMTRHQGLFYNQEECRELSQYAHRYGISIIPEIDMPGHSAAFMRAMGFPMLSEQGIGCLKQVLKELADVFPDAPYIHIGGDEADDMPRGFLREMIDYVHQLGRRAVVWVPTQGDFTGVDMVQLWSSAGHLVPGVPNIDCRYNYINHFDTFADIVGIYRSNIYGWPKGSQELAGEISAVWNDHRLHGARDILLQNNFYAAVIASATRAWMGGGRQYIEEGGVTLPNERDELRDFCDWERRFLFHKAHSLCDEPIAYVKQTDVRWRITDPIPNGGKATAFFRPTPWGRDRCILSPTAFIRHISLRAPASICDTHGALPYRRFIPPDTSITRFMHGLLCILRERKRPGRSSNCRITVGRNRIVVRCPVIGIAKVRVYGSMM